MTKLNQIVATERTANTNAERDLTEAYHTVQKDQLFGGIEKSYKPRDDAGDKLPTESTKVQQTTEALLDAAANALIRLFDLRYTKDVANRVAKADLVVDGVTLQTDVPVTFLLTLEDKLTHLRTFVTHLPVLDPAETWEHDGASGVWKSKPIEATRTQKVPKTVEKAPATDKHPAQVELYMADVIVGDYTTYRFSGRTSKERQDHLLVQIDKLIRGAKFAREAANNIEIEELEIGKTLLDFILRG